jgi:hypothetical protein
MYPCMEKMFNTGGMGKEAIDWLIFRVISVEMTKAFLRFGGDVHKLGPPLDHNPRSLLLECFKGLKFGGELWVGY